MTNKQKLKIRKLMLKSYRSYLACANARRAQVARTRKVVPSKVIERVLGGFSEDNIRWLFRREPEVGAMLVRKDVRKLTLEQRAFLSDTIEEIETIVDRRSLVADTLIEQFDAHFARGRCLSPSLTSRVLFDAGVAPMYFRVKGTKLEPCIGELVSAADPVHLFQSEVEPLLRHAQLAENTEFIELLEIVPKLSLRLAPYLTAQGWRKSNSWPESSGYGVEWAVSYCRPSLDRPALPSRTLRRALSRWQRERAESVRRDYERLATTMKSRG